MADYIFLMHDDAAGPVPGDAWPPYLERLRASGAFRGGSAIGPGVCLRKTGTPPAISGHLGGFLRVEVADMEQARALVAGNPVYEAGGTVEIRELPRDD